MYKNIAKYHKWLLKQFKNTRLTQGTAIKNEINQDTIRLAYQLILGRNPESEAAVNAHLNLATVAKLRLHMMNSPEFKSQLLQSQFSSNSKWVAVDVLACYTQWVDLHDRFVSQGCLNNNWEPSETDYFISKLQTGNVVVDVGANIGWFSLVAAKHIGESGVVHAFEPRPETAKMLKRTIKDNALDNQVSVWELALSDSVGMLDLVWSKDTDNPGGSFVAGKNTNLAQFDSAKIIAKPFDEVLPDIAPDVIKIDVEGAEPKVMMGMQNALKRKHPPILSELYPAQLKSVSGVTAAEYINQMKSYGYNCYLLENGAPTKKLVDFPTNHVGNLVSVVFERNE